MGNILFPMSSLSNMVNYDRDILLDKLLQRLQMQNKKITNLRIRLLQLKLQSGCSNQGKRHCMRSSRDSNSRDDVIIEKLERILNQRFQINPIAQNQHKQHKSLSEHFNSLNLMKINEWQKDHNTCNYHYQYNQYEHMNPRLNYYTIRNKDRYGSIVASSDSFSWNEQ